MCVRTENLMIKPQLAADVSDVWCVHNWQGDTALVWKGWEESEIDQWKMKSRKRKFWFLLLKIVCSLHGKGSCTLTCSFSVDLEAAARGQCQESSDSELLLPKHRSLRYFWTSPHLLPSWSRSKHWRLYGVYSPSGERTALQPIPWIYCPCDPGDLSVFFSFLQASAHWEIGKAKVGQAAVASTDRVWWWCPCKKEPKLLKRLSSQAIAQLCTIEQGKRR